MQNRRSFITKALTALTAAITVPLAALRGGKPAVRLRKAVVWSRRDVPTIQPPIYAESWADLRPGDVFTIHSQDKDDTTDYAHNGKMWRVVAGPFPMNEPAVHGVHVEEVKC